MAKRYILKLRGYGLVDGVKQACYVVVDTGTGGAYVEVYPNDKTQCLTKAAAQAKLQELNGV